jgi:hypothetical protein
VVGGLGQLAAVGGRGLRGRVGRAVALAGRRGGHVLGHLGVLGLGGQRAGRHHGALAVHQRRVGGHLGLGLGLGLADAGLLGGHGLGRRGDGLGLRGRCRGRHVAVARDRLRTAGLLRRVRERVRRVGGGRGERVVL